MKRCPIFINHLGKNPKIKIKQKTNPPPSPEQNFLSLVFFGVFLLSLFLFQYSAESTLFRIMLLEHQYFLFYLAYNSFCSSYLSSPWYQLSFGTQVLCVEYYLSQPYSEKVELDLKSEEGFETKSFGLKLLRDFESQQVFLK